MKHFVTISTLFVVACTAQNSIPIMVDLGGAWPGPGADGVLETTAEVPDSGSQDTTDMAGDLALDGQAETVDICVPDCGLKNCGPNGCGGTCGECYPADCNIGWCSAASGMCTYEPDVDGLPCDDTDACTPPGTCQQGQCIVVLPEEICGDEIDNDCDGQVDEDC
jgi:hypothetical protein